jgi:hypothetical protein
VRGGRGPHPCARAIVSLPSGLQLTASGQPRDPRECSWARRSRETRAFVRRQRACGHGLHPSVRGHRALVRGHQRFVRRQRTNVRGNSRMSVDNRRLSVDNRRLSVDIALLSLAPHPLPAADRRLDVVPIHVHKEVRTATRFPRTECDIATLAVRVIDGLTNAAGFGSASREPEGRAAATTCRRPDDAQERRAFAHLLVCESGRRDLDREAASLKGERRRQHAGGLITKRAA